MPEKIDPELKVRAVRLGERAPAGVPVGHGGY